MNTQDKIKLSTLKGKVGYKINKFQLMSTTPGIGTAEYIAKIYTTDQDGSIGPVVDFSDPNLIAVAHLENINTASALHSNNLEIIFDNMTFNQDIYVTIDDNQGGTVPCNYYLELETMSLSDLESTMLTLKSLRTLASQ